MTISKFCMFIAVAALGLNSAKSFAGARCFPGFRIEGISNNASAGLLNVSFAYDKSKQSVLAINSTFDLSNQSLKFVLETAIMKRSTLDVCVADADEVKKVDAALAETRKPGTPRSEYTFKSIVHLSLPL